MDKNRSKFTIDTVQHTGGKKKGKTQSQSDMCNYVLRVSGISSKRMFLELYSQMTRKPKFNTGENMQCYKLLGKKNRKIERKYNFTSVQIHQTSNLETMCVVSPLRGLMVSSGEKSY